MRCLVTGANGLIGARLVRGLAVGGVHAVAALGRGAHSAPPMAGVDYHAVDLTDAAAVQAAVAAVRPDVVVHCAALTDVDACERDRAAAWAVNVAAVATLCSAARGVDAHVVLVSTDYVFDGEAGPYDVDAVPNPRGVYALSKHAAEQAVRILCPEGTWTIARTAVVYGWPPERKTNFGAWLVDALRAGRSVRLFADQWVSPTLAASAAAMLGELAARRLGGIWHVCGGEVVDRVDFGRRLCARFGFDAGLIEPVRRQDVALAGPRPRHTGLVVEKTSAALAARPLALDEALEQFHAEVERAA